MPCSGDTLTKWMLSDMGVGLNHAGLGCTAVFDHWVSPLPSCSLYLAGVSGHRLSYLNLFSIFLMSFQDGLPVKYTDYKHACISSLAYTQYTQNAQMHTDVQSSPKMFLPNLFPLVLFLFFSLILESGPHSGINKRNVSLNFKFYILQQYYILQFTTAHVLLFEMKVQMLGYVC